MSNYKFAVWGNPIEHSLSPQVHQMFVEQRQKTIDYVKLGQGMDEKTFIDAFTKFFNNEGGQGCNVTSPFKNVVYDLIAQRSETSQIAQACNTVIKLPDGSLKAENTDGYGLLTDLQDLGWVEAGSKILILGAGGAVSGVLFNLLQAGAKVVIFNRTYERALNLANRFQKFGDVSATTDYELNDFDVVINAVAYSGQQKVSLRVTKEISKHLKFYDMQYARTGRTLFLEYIHQLGVTNYTDGLGMLVKQAALSHFYWFGVWPDANLVLGQLRAQFANETDVA